MDSILILFGGFVAVVVSLVFNTILRGYVLTWLWLWFVIPVFNLPQLNLIQAIGISSLVAFLTVKTSPNRPDEKNKKSLTYLIVETTSYSILALLIGYIIKSFM